MTARIITISASFGAGGSLVGPAVAARLGLPFVDRIIPATVAEELDVPLGRVLAHDEKPASIVSRLISKLGATALPYGATPVAGSEPVVDEDVFRDRTEQVIRDLANAGGGVVLGRAAAIVLAGHPLTLHVRLDGARDARVQRVADRHGIEPARAAELLDEADRAREAYVRHFYKADAHDARLYHVKIDSIVVPPDTCVELIVSAAAAISSA
jgi:cytidylate kinase